MNIFRKRDNRGVIIFIIPSVDVFDLGLTYSFNLKNSFFADFFLIFNIFRAHRELQAPGQFPSGYESSHLY